jgi:hypothetical protein
VSDEISLVTLRGEAVGSDLVPAGMVAGQWRQPARLQVVAQRESAAQDLRAGTGARRQDAAPNLSLVAPESAADGMPRSEPGTHTLHDRAKRVVDLCCASLLLLAFAPLMLLVAALIRFSGAPVLFRNLGLRPIAQDNGRQAVTNLATDAGRFKTPSLRNAGLRTQFMHTGQFQNLGQVLGFYINGGGPELINKDPLLVRLQPPPPAPPIPPQVINEVIDFVSNALTDPRVRNRQFPFDRPTLLSERIPTIGLQFGASTPGSGLQVPSMLAGVPANIGNADFKVGVGNSLGGAPALLAVSTTASLPGTTFAGFALNIGLPELALLPIALEGPAGLPGRGFGTVMFPVPFDPGFSGLTVFVQWFVADPNGISSVAASRGAEIRFF